MVFPMKLYISSDNQNQAYVDGLHQQLEVWVHDVCRLHDAENIEDIMQTSDIIIGILSKSTLNKSIRVFTVELVDCSSA